MTDHGLCDHLRGGKQREKCSRQRDVNRHRTPRKRQHGQPGKQTKTYNENSVRK